MRRQSSDCRSIADAVDSCASGGRVETNKQRVASRDEEMSLPEAALYLGVSPDTLRWRSNNGFQPHACRIVDLPVKGAVLKHRYYKRSDLDMFVEMEVPGKPKGNQRYNGRIPGQSCPFEIGSVIRRVLPMKGVVMIAKVIDPSVFVLPNGETVYSMSAVSKYYLGKHRGGGRYGTPSELSKWEVL